MVKCLSSPRRAGIFFFNPVEPCSLVIHTRTPLGGSRIFVEGQRGYAEFTAPLLTSALPIGIQEDQRGPVRRVGLSPIL
jgi:hypothetical protein